MICSICDNQLPPNVEEVCDDCIQLLNDLEDLHKKHDKLGRPVREHRRAFTEHHRERVSGEEPRIVQRTLCSEG